MSDDRLGASPHLHTGLRAALGAVALVAVLAGCGETDEAPSDLGETPGSSPPTTAAASPSSPISAASTASTVATTGSEPEVGAGGDTPIDVSELCRGLRATSDGRVEHAGLIELSGLVASVRNEGVVWAHNDSGRAPAVFAIGTSGANLGSFLLPGVSAVDIEDIALTDGALHLADIGDNDGERAEIAVYRFPEPEPGTGDSIGEGDVEVIRLAYPDGPRDAEAFLVDPLTGQFVIIEKVFGVGGGGGGFLGPTEATIYVADPPFDGGINELRPAGTVAMDVLADRATAPPPEGALFTAAGLEGLATGADIRADGRVLAVRTYATVWLFARNDGETVVDALASEPCEAPTLVEDQGEAVALLSTTDGSFVTASEGPNPAWNTTRPS